MKVIEPDPLLADAAEVLRSVRDDVVVFGASAVRVALDGRNVPLTPTRDVDAALRVDAVDRVIGVLEDAGLTRSKEAHETAFTWVRRDLKVQLIRPFHPYAKGAAKRLPVNQLLSAMTDHRTPVAFAGDPDRIQLWCANAAWLVPLKARAFGRERDGIPVDRDYGDVVLLLEFALDDIVLQTQQHPDLRRRVMKVAEEIRANDGAIAAAARELTATGAYGTLRDGRVAVNRACSRAIRELAR